MTGAQQGFLLIADITGYTMYLSQSELEQAHHVFQTLLKELAQGKHTLPDTAAIPAEQIGEAAASSLREA